MATRLENLQKKQARPHFLSALAHESFSRGQNIGGTSVLQNTLSAIESWVGAVLEQGQCSGLAMGKP